MGEQVHSRSASLSDFDCPFCLPQSERIAFVEPLVKAIWDAFPVSEGHLLLTPHRIVAGPYHRLNEDIVFAKQMMQMEPRGAIAALRDRGIGYVVTCASFNEPIASTQDPDKALYPALISEHVPDDLERLHPAGQELQIWRIKPKAE